METYEITIRDIHLNIILQQTVSSSNYSDVVAHADKLQNFFGFNCYSDIEEIEN